MSDWTVFPNSVGSAAIVVWDCPAFSNRVHLEISRWRVRTSQGRHAARNGRRPRPAGVVWTWPERTAFRCATHGLTLWQHKRSRKTMGFKKAKRRQWSRDRFV